MRPWTPSLGLKKIKQKSRNLPKLKTKLIQRLQLIAKIKPSLYRIARAHSQYKEMYPPMPTSPTDVHMYEPSPGFKWTNLLKDWQPFKRSAATNVPSPSAETSPMEIDQTLRLADGRVTSPMDLSMWHLTRLSNAKVKAESERKTHNKIMKPALRKRMVLTKPGRSLAAAMGNAPVRAREATRPVFGRGPLYRQGLKDAHRAPGPSPLRRSSTAASGESTEDRPDSSPRYYTVGRPTAQGHP